ncbi:uncharacterized protein LOC141505606 [Macrotis lagotis]|uniref:uncharacterized protein LOC141505606 n=1 Tax=Macrotis lagotis TaxID=92651 RepID=UPI003D6961AE
MTLDAVKDTGLLKSNFFHFLNLIAMLRLSKEEIVESRENMEMGEKIELQEEKKSSKLPGEIEASSSGSMLVLGATMSVLSEPENSGSEEMTEEFVELSLPPQLVSEHFEDLENALSSPDLPPIYQTDNKHLNDSNCDSSDDSNIMLLHDSGSGHSDSDSYSDSYDDCDVYSDDFKLEQGSHTGDLDLHKPEHNLTKAVERSQEAIEENKEEEYREHETRSEQKDSEAPPSASILVNDATKSALNDPEWCESEGYSNEPPSRANEGYSDEGSSGEFPSFVPGQFENSEDVLMHPKSPPNQETWKNRVLTFAKWLEPETCTPGCFSLCVVS